MARNDQAVKLEAGIVKQAKIISTQRGVTIAEYLSDLPRPQVARGYKDALNQLTQEKPADAPTPRPKKGGK